MKKKIICLALAAVLLLSLSPVLASPGEYADIPAGSWALGYIYSARDAGLMTGVSDSSFGFGQDILRRDFVVILCRMFSWPLVSPKTAAFSDVAPGGFYYSYIETALERGVFDKSPAFEPDRAITREEMAVMLVRSLGYSYLAEQVKGYGHGFTDVTENAGYITIAADIGMITGIDATTFAPGQTATREQAAAMMMRVYDKIASKTEWLHGFYAFSSFNQRYVTRQMDAVSLGWSCLCLDNSGVWLNTGGTGSNEWRIPSSYDSITTYLDDGGTRAHLDVYMDMSAKITVDGVSVSALRELLASDTHRTAAVDAIVNEAVRKYDAIGKSPYSGVTIDFEGLREQDKPGFSAFIALLSGKLKPLGLGLYVTVQPVVYGDAYYDGFDYRAIGEYADKVILMAHDYQPTSLEDSLVGSTWQNNTPLTPMAKVYYALRAITDSETGIQDKSKIALAISFSTVGWQLDSNGRIAVPVSISPHTETVYTRMTQSEAVQGWSDRFRNPYMTYTTGGNKYFLWYENERSIAEKTELARLFGINGISVWRIGTIPDYAGVYDVWSVLAAR